MRVNDIYINKYICEANEKYYNNNNDTLTVLLLLLLNLLLMLASDVSVFEIHTRKVMVSGNNAVHFNNQEYNRKYTIVWSVYKSSRKLHTHTHRHTYNDKCDFEIFGAKTTSVDWNSIFSLYFSSIFFRCICYVVWYCQRKMGVKFSFSIFNVREN